MIPLKQWVCDTCREVIEKPEDGVLEWLRSPDRMWAFLISHKGGCRRHVADTFHRQLSLKIAIEPDGLVELLTEVNGGPLFGDRPSRSVEASFAEVFRRLYVPYYEEARQLFQEALAAGYYGPPAQYWGNLGHYSQVELRKLVERFGSLRSIEVDGPEAGNGPQESSEER